ncbi:hypothetical protein N0V90_004241 [Kalmusia sp. IMI 367209]|nr:hypothetical protein N0V90_004241 [Kalmusia sp. IMI 367209]
MATSAQQTMERVESRRLQLEETVVKLKKALDHWSTWEIEYEMLKEELQAAGSPSPSQMVEIARDMDGKIVTETEVEELLGKDAQSKRTANQVIDMISRRIDYVRQNRESAEKQFDKTEKQLDGFAMLTDPGLENEEGLPMMDIEEELDEHDNVVSSSVSQPGNVAPELVEALRKAGVHKAEQKNGKGERASDLELPSATSAPVPSTLASDPASDWIDYSVKLPSPSEPLPVNEPKPAGPPKKSVSFANDVQVETFEKPKTFQEDVQYWNLKPGAKVYELDDDTEDILSKAVVPDTDSAEEAALRREMIQYGLSEVNDVVAELDLEDEDDEDDFDEEYDSDEDSEEEDKFGRSTRRVLDDDYLKQMQDLEKKLNARMVENLGPSSALIDEAGDARTLRVRKDDEFEQSMSTAFPGSVEDSAAKKGVRFADDIDISDAPPPPAEPSVPIKLPPTMSDTIIERAPSVPQPPSLPSRAARVSRFKSARATSNGPPPMLPSPAVPEPPPVPTGPSGRVLATKVSEHIAYTSEPQAPDEFDPVMHDREIQAEYHKLRNKMVQQQGGFKSTEEDDEDAFVEERNGKTKKVSRFKAAKLKAEGL